MKGEEERSVPGSGNGMCKGPEAGKQIEMIRHQEGRQSYRAKKVQLDLWEVKPRQVFIFVLKAMGATDRS